MRFGGSDEGKRFVKRGTVSSGRHFIGEDLTQVVARRKNERGSSSESPKKVSLPPAAPLMGKAFRGIRRGIRMFRGDFLVDPLVPSGGPPFIGGSAKTCHRNPEEKRVSSRLRVAPLSGNAFGGIRRGIRWGSSGDLPAFWGIRSGFVSVWRGFQGDPFETTVVFYNFKQGKEVRRSQECPRGLALHSANAGPRVAP